MRVMPISEMVFWEMRLFAMSFQWLPEFPLYNKVGNMAWRCGGTVSECRYE